MGQSLSLLLLFVIIILLSSKHNSCFANESSFGRNLYVKVKKLLHVHCTLQLTLKSRLILRTCVQNIYSYLRTAFLISHAYIVNLCFY